MVSEQHVGKRVIVILAAFAVAACIMATLGAGLAVAQQTQNTANETATQIEYELENVDIHNVEFENGTVFADVTYNDYATVAITDSASVSNLGANDGAGVAFSTFTNSEGEYRLKMDLSSDDELVTIQQGEKMYAASGERGIIEIFQSQPTGTQIGLSLVTGVLGTLIAFAIWIGFLKKQHKNSYTEIFSDTRIKIERDPVEGVWEGVSRALNGLSSSYWRVFATTSIVFVGVLMLFGFVPGPGDAWTGASDMQRLAMAGTTASTGLGLLTAPILLQKIWNPATQFVLDLDATDVYGAAAGDRSGGVAAYSAPPSRIREMEIDGSPTATDTDGGVCHLVRDFDPSENTAEASIPEVADDREVSIEASKIEYNRGIMTDFALVARDLIGAMSAFRVTADTQAMRDIDAGLRDAVSTGGDPFEDVLTSAVEGTRWEGTYNPERIIEDADRVAEPRKGDNDDNNSNSNNDSDDGDSGGSSE